MKCFDSLFKEHILSQSTYSMDNIKGQTDLHFVFMGDSRIRQQYYNCLQVNEKFMHLKKFSWEKGLDSIFLAILIFKCNFGISSTVRKITLLKNLAIFVTCNSQKAGNKKSNFNLRKSGRVFRNHRFVLVINLDFSFLSVYHTRSSFFRLI